MNAGIVRNIEDELDSYEDALGTFIIAGVDNPFAANIYVIDEYGSPASFGHSGFAAIGSVRRLRDSTS